MLRCKFNDLALYLIGNTAEITLSGPHPIDAELRLRSR